MKLWYDLDTHDIDLAIYRHRTPPHHVLRGGGKTWTECMKEPHDVWVLNSIKSMVGSYENADYITVKALEQSSRKSQLKYTHSRT